MKILQALPLLIGPSIATSQTLFVDLPVSGSIGPAGDFDGDGRDDFQVGRSIYSGLDQSVLFSTGVGLGGSSTVVNDWDGDGVPDLVVPDTGVYYVVSGSTGAVLHTGCLAWFCERPVEIRNAGDTDGDGLDDLLFLAYDQICDGDVVVYHRGGDGGNQVVITDYLGWTYQSPASLGDLDGDGLAEWGYFDIWSFPSTEVTLSNGLGSFNVDYPLLSVPDAPDLEAVGDLDGDGRDDILVSSSGATPKTRVLSSADLSTVLLDLPFYESLAGPGDIDCDGLPDVLGANLDRNTDIGTFVLHSGADGAVLWSLTIAAELFIEVAPAGDLNGDGVPDWLVGSLGYTRAYLGQPPSPVTYCAGKTSSAGCTPAVDYGGVPTLSGPDNFLVLTRDSLALKPGLFFFGTSGAANVPFLGGTLCVLPPLTRTPVQVSSGGQDCQAGLAFHFDQAYAASEGFTAGDAVHGQFWMRDPAQVDGTGVVLSNGISWAWCP